MTMRFGTLIPGGQAIRVATDNPRLLSGQTALGR
jgi:hypothetical protein